MEFYTRVMGLQAVTFGAGRQALAFGAQKINLHEHGREFEPKAANPTPGSADLCFVTTAEIATVIEQLQREQVAILEGPAPASERWARCSRCSSAIPTATRSRSRATASSRSERVPRRVGGGATPRNARSLFLRMASRLPDSRRFTPAP